jgi:hypothetical protein
MSGAKRRHGLARAATVVVVAYVLVLQALLSAIAGSSGAAAAIWQDPGIICSEHGAAPGAPAPSGPAHHDAGCCILHVFGLDRGAAPPPTLSVLPAPAAAPVKPTGPVTTVFSHRSHGVRPLGARAPPIPI